MALAARTAAVKIHGRKYSSAGRRNALDDEDVPSVGGISSITASNDEGSDAYSETPDYPTVRGGALSHNSVSHTSVTRGVAAPTRRDGIMTAVQLFPRIGISNLPELLRSCNIKCDQAVVDELWLSIVGLSGATYADPLRVCDVLLNHGGTYLGPAAFSSPQEMPSPHHTPTTSTTKTALNTIKRRESPPSRLPGHPPTRAPPTRTTTVNPTPRTQSKDKRSGSSVREARRGSVERSRTPEIKLSVTEMDAVSQRLYGEAELRRKKYQERRAAAIEERWAAELEQCTGKPKTNTASLAKMHLSQRSDQAYSQMTASWASKRRTHTPDRRSPSASEEVFTLKLGAIPRRPNRDVEIKGFYQAVARMRQASPIRSTSPARIFEDSLRSYSALQLPNSPPHTFGEERSRTPPNLSRRASSVFKDEVERQARLVETTLHSHDGLVVNHFDEESTPLFHSDSLSYHPATGTARRILDEKMKLGELTYRESTRVAEALQLLTSVSLLDAFAPSGVVKPMTKYADSYHEQHLAKLVSHFSSPSQRRFESPTKAMLLARGSIRP